jgi:pyruvate kinase
MQIHRTKIITTLDSATDEPEALRALIEVGAEILRTN